MKGIAMNRFGAPYLFLLLFPLLAIAQEQWLLVDTDHSQYKAEYYRYDRLFSAPSAKLQWIAPKNYDVLRYDLFLDWRNPLSGNATDPESKQYWGRNTMTVVITDDNVTEITVDAADMVIDSVFIDDHRYPDTIVINNQQFLLDLSLAQLSNLQQGDTLRIAIYYRYIGNARSGFFLFPKGMFVGVRNGDTVRVLEQLAYTMSEPEDAHRWFPCNDIPNDKALATISIRVPQGFITASNGLLTDTIIHTDQSRTYVWEHRYPIPPYLMVIHASRYFFWSEWYHSILNPQDSVEIQYYTWREDYEGTAAGDYNAPQAFRNMLRMMEAFEKHYGKYPFEKYGMAAVQPFYFGGMEHQTMTTINRVWLRGADDGIAHELAHQWLGDKVSCATWADIWLNEGGATYGEAVWREESEGWEGYHNKMLEHRNGYFNGGDNTLPIYNPPPFRLFNYATTYAKAGWVYHMLRQMLGDSTFYSVLHAYMDRFAYGNATTEEFKQTFIDLVPNPPVDFSTFFDQWVYKAGHPRYNMIASVDETLQNVTVTIEQLQTGNNVPDVFVMPLEIEFIGTNGERHIERVINSERTQQFSFSLPFAVANVLLDPFDKVLCEKEITITSVQNAAARTAMSVRYIPQHHGIEFRSETPLVGSLSLQLYTTFGRKVASFSVVLNGNSRQYFALPAPLPPGAYGIILHYNSRIERYPIVVFPE